MTIQVILWSGEWCISFFSHRSAISFCGDRRWALREHLLSAYPGGLSMVTWGHLQVGYRNVKKQCAAFVCVILFIYIYIYTSSGSFWNPETASTWLRQHLIKIHQNPELQQSIPLSHDFLTSSMTWFVPPRWDLTDWLCYLAKNDRIFRTEWFRGPWPGTKPKNMKKTNSIAKVSR